MRDETKAITINCNVVKGERLGVEVIGMQLTMMGLTMEEALSLGNRLKPILEAELHRIHEHRGDAKPYRSTIPKTGETSELIYGNPKKAN